MVEDLLKYYSLLKDTPIARGRYEISGPDDADEIQRLLFGLGFKWRSGRLYIIDIGSKQKFIYSNLTCDEISAFQRQICGTISTSVNQMDFDQDDQPYISVSLDQLRGLYLNITGNSAISLTPNKPQTPFEELW